MFINVAVRPGVLARSGQSAWRLSWNIVAKTNVVAPLHCGLADRTRFARAILPLGGKSRTFSASPGSKGLFDRAKDYLSDRNIKKQKDQTADHILLMANSKVWTIKAFADTIDDSLSGWQKYVPGVGSTSQMKQIKEAQRVVGSIRDAVGGDATADDLNKLGRREKLKVSLKADVSLDDLNAFVTQFTFQSLMQQLLRKRKLSGKPIPTEEGEMKAMLQADGQKMMSKEQKKQFQKNQAKGGINSFS
mmetsp:Transcript_179/g.420  ORF Transcript_179/g.420 Transcript_179/m.420 type:complete len:247 (-) Transcript_179:1112-1852(-)